MTPKTKIAVDDLIEVISIEYPYSNISKLKESIHSYIDHTISKNIVTIDYIKNVVASFCGVSVVDLESKSRLRDTVVFPRQAAHTITFFVLGDTKNGGGISLQTIGDKIGNKDHATVMHSVKQISRLMNDKSIFNSYAPLFNQFGILDKVMNYTA